MKLGDTIPDKALAILTVIVIGFVVWDGRPGSLVEYLIGVIIGGVTVFVFMSTPPALHAPTAKIISAANTITSNTPNGRYCTKPARSSAKSMSSIITTNRNSTATAPT